MATKSTKPTMSTFHVSGRISVQVGVEIQAPSWEEALAVSQKLKVEDFITVGGDYEDGDDVKLTTLWKED